MRHQRRIDLARALDSNETVSLEELFKSQIAVQDALLLLLERKGLITRAELMEGDYEREGADG